MFGRCRYIDVPIFMSHENSSGPNSRRSAAVNDSSSSIRGCGSAVLCAAALVLAAGKAVAWAADVCVAKTQKCRKIETMKKPFARQKPAEWLSIWDPQHLESRIESLIGSCISSFFCLTEKHIRLKASRVFANNTQTHWHGCVQSSRWHSMTRVEFILTIQAQRSVRKVAPNPQVIPVTWICGSCGLLIFLILKTGLSATPQCSFSVRADAIFLWHWIHGSSVVTVSGETRPFSPRLLTSPERRSAGCSTATRMADIGQQLQTEGKTVNRESSNPTPTNPSNPTMEVPGSDTWKILEVWHQGEEELQLQTFRKTTANYVVHQALRLPFWGWTEAKFWSKRLLLVAVWIFTLW